MEQQAPARKPNSECKIILGMTGRSDSAVAAYLLKRQGYQVIGLTIDYFGQSGDQTVSSSHHSLGQIAKCYIQSFEQVKKLCDQMEIVHYAASAVERFKDVVLDQVVAARLSGREVSTHYLCSQLTLDILVEKADLLEAEFIATGHYAKLMHDPIHNQYNIYTVNGLEYDQSSLLANVTQDQLSKLFLPLSDMRKVDVHSLVKHLQLPVESKETTCDHCFLYNRSFNTYLAEQVPSSLCRSGNYYFERWGGDSLGEHKGYQNHWIGEKDLLNKEGESINRDLEVVAISHRNGDVVLGSRDKYSYDYCVLSYIQIHIWLDQSVPIECYLMLAPDAERLPVTISFKSGSTGVVRFKSAQQGVLEQGKFIVLYNRPGPGGKLLLSGIMTAHGEMHEFDQTVAAKHSSNSNTEEYDFGDDEEAEDEQSTDHS
ncbi:MAG: hypothetical protein HN353_11175 [Bdellovibrionales bacterium]|jgi:tRNA-uridine 2-sulfurtransferase|nr:hypothetical protein [Bdellovibrionales bacterium]MBT3525169.1 hypothetical protein [Bdellovibrionales bacterium]MBT7669493.1 hypothetical protein [Bdellovibrionales bacterium]